MAYKLKYTGEEIDSLLTKVLKYDGTNSASGSSARELYVDSTGQGLTDEQKAYNAETFTLLQTQGFSMFVDDEGYILYPINSAGIYQPGDESIRLQYTMYNTNLSRLMIGDFTLAQDGTVAISPTMLEYKLTPYTEDEDTGEGETNVIIRELRVNVNDYNQNYNAATYEKAVKGLNERGSLPMLFYPGGREHTATLLTIFGGAMDSTLEDAGWDFADRTKGFIGFVSPILANINNELMQIRIALHEDGSYEKNNHVINILTQ